MRADDSVATGPEFGDFESAFGAKPAPKAHITGGEDFAAFGTAPPSVVPAPAASSNLSFGLHTSAPPAASIPAAGVSSN